MAIPVGQAPEAVSSQFSKHIVSSIALLVGSAAAAECEGSEFDLQMIEVPERSPPRGARRAGMTPSLNHAPVLYADFLLQFPDKKLKAMQKAFLTGSDLTPFVDERVVSAFAGGGSAGRPPAPNEILASMTTAVCWGLAAPDILKGKGGGAKAGYNLTLNPGMGGEMRQRSFSVGGEGFLDCVLQGESCELVGWMKEWKDSSEHQEMIKTAICSPPEELACNKHGVSVVGHGGFGLKRVAGSNSDVPAIPFDRQVPRYYRTLVVSNESSETVVLLDVCGIPSVRQTFILHDDYRLAHHYGSDKDRRTSSGDKASAAVTLLPGAQYQVTVELWCSEQDVAWHQQWLLFIFGSGNPLQNHKEIFVIGRCVSALIGHNIQDVQKCLSTEAKPFYPASLRGLFDTRPGSYEVVNATRAINSRDWRREMPAFVQTHLSSVWPQQLYYLEEALHSGAMLLKPSCPTQRCMCTIEQLRQLSHLLALEEASMEGDIKEYDLFNVQLIYIESSNFLLEVPGLPENRPSVFVDDLVYIRLERFPQVECAAEVVALEFQPTPRLILKVPPAFMKSCPLPPASVLVHARFTFDRLFLTRMHFALEEVAVLSTPLLPCMCSLRVKDVRNDLPATPFDEISSPKPRINKCLNEEQWKAVTDIVEGVHGAGPYIILGPPGTGKTVTMVECVLQLLSRYPLARLLVCAPSNFAADILCSGIAAGGINPSMMWRMNDPRRTMASIKIDILKYCSFGLHHKVTKEKLGFKVIVSTCGAAGMLNEMPLMGRLEALTHVLIDEAGQALIPESLIPLSLGNANTTYVLCGDPKQLGPVVHSRQAAENGLDDTLIARFQRSEEASAGSGRLDSSPVTKLVRNYRANGKLLELPSRLFYNNELIAAAQPSTITPPKDWEELKGRDFPMLFYGVRGQQMREGESPSYFNAVEAGKVVDLICGLLAKTQIKPNDIGVMAPYRRQVQKLRLVLRSKQLGTVRVGTVDDYQGQEEKIVFISTVVTRPECLKQNTASGKNRHIGFLSNAKRFNVAITRAKAMLVVVGHPLVLSLDENWRELLRYCLAKDAFRGYGSEVVSPLIPHEFSTEQSATDEDTSELGWNDEEERVAMEALETTKAIEKLAELSLLGMGDRDRLYPVDLDSMYSAFTEDLEWRIQL